MKIVMTLGLRFLPRFRDSGVVSMAIMPAHALEV